MLCVPSTGAVSRIRIDILTAGLQRGCGVWVGFRVQGPGMELMGEVDRDRGPVMVDLGSTLSALRLGAKSSCCFEKSASKRSMRNADG